MFGPACASPNSRKTSHAQFSSKILDHLVGKVEHAWRNREAERVGGLQVDDQREFRWVLNGEVGRTGAPEDACDVGCRLGVHIDWVEGIEHQGACSEQAGQSDTR